MTWQPTRVDDLVANARVLTDGIDAPLIRTVANLAPCGDKFRRVDFTDGHKRVFEVEAEVWACLP